MLLGPAAQAVAPAQITGTHLHAALLPMSYFPVGDKVEKIQNYSSGGRPEHGPAKVHLASSTPPAGRYRPSRPSRPRCCT
jgi:hypothetical protein